MDRKADVGRDRAYTKAEIDQVKAAIKADPQLGRQLIDSARAGNQADLEFLIQAGVSIFSDSPEESVVRDMPRDLQEG